jgi:hypothetical protein
MARIIDDAYDRLEILKQYRRIAMVGLSANEFRPSHFAAIYMRSEGYEIIPVNPRYEEVFGRRCYPSLSAAAEAGEAPEIVDVFRKPEEVPAIAEEAIEVGAKVLWLQLGIEHEEAAERAVDAGLDVVMNRCVKIEHARFFGGLHAIGLNTGVISSRIAEG